MYLYGGNCTVSYRDEYSHVQHWCSTRDMVVATEQKCQVSDLPKSILNEPTNWEWLVARRMDMTSFTRMAELVGELEPYHHSP